MTKHLGAFLLCTLALTPGSAFATDHYLLVLAGLGGEDSYEAGFDAQVARLREAATSLGIPASSAHFLDGESATAPAIIERLTQLKSQLSSEDQLMVFLVGHGSFDGEAYKFNIPGPDITGIELSHLLNAIPGEQLVVVMTSASGALADLLQRDNRVVITATKSGLERNAPVFGHFWTTGMTSTEADSNKNELVTAAELYEYTANQVASHYQDDALLATEHSLISDSASADNFVVARIGKLGSGTLTEVAQELLDQRNEVEQRIQNLMSTRTELSESDYFNRLETLMLELGRVQQQIDVQLEEGDGL